MLRHLQRVKTRYRIHSPFLYEFCTQVLPHRPSLAGEQIKALRRSLVHDTRSIALLDMGAGSSDRSPGQSQVTLGRLVQKATRSRREGELLYRICRHYQIQRGIELGTHVGISTAYQVMGHPGATFFTLEGAPALAEIARSTFRQLDIHPRLITGDFAASLSLLDLADFQPDYVFVDGNHRYQPTLDYFHCLLPYMAEGGIMVFDDVHWSRGMERAWETICRHPEVSLSIDLYTMGLCFIRRPQVKTHVHLFFLPWP